VEKRSAVYKEMLGVVDFAELINNKLEDINSPTILFEIVHIKFNSLITLTLSIDRLI
jgi:hypothetical protein